MYNENLEIVSLQIPSILQNPGPAHHLVYTTSPGWPGHLPSVLL